eukprot:350468-Chlamydomonas_euryale.AAC.15
MAAHDTPHVAWEAVSAAMRRAVHGGLRRADVARLRRRRRRRRCVGGVGGGVAPHQHLGRERRGSQSPPAPPHPPCAGFQGVDAKLCGASVAAAAAAAATPPSLSLTLTRGARGVISETSTSVSARGREESSEGNAPLTDVSELPRCVPLPKPRCSKARASSPWPPPPLTQPGRGVGGSSPRALLPRKHLSPQSAKAMAPGALEVDHIHAPSSWTPTTSSLERCSRSRQLTRACCNAAYANVAGAGREPPAAPQRPGAVVVTHPASHATLGPA